MKSYFRYLLYPTRDRVIYFLLIFGGIHIFNLVLIFLVAGFWDAGLYIGFPIPFYVINCGLIRGSGVCNYGFHIGSLLINLLLWYCIVTAVRRKQK